MSSTNPHSYLTYLARGVPGVSMRGGPISSGPPTPPPPAGSINVPSERPRKFVSLLNIAAAAASHQRRSAGSRLVVAEVNNAYSSELLAQSEAAVPITRSFGKNDCAATKQAWFELVGSSPVGARDTPPVPLLSFSQMHSAQASSHFSKVNPGCRLYVMNFANGESPGGGYTRGARAQEEDLCRQFPLYWPSLYRSCTSSETSAFPFGPSCGLGTERYSQVLVTHDLECMRADASEQYRVLESGADHAVDTFIAAAAPMIRFGQEKGDAAALTDTIEHVLWAPLFDGSGDRQRLNAAAAAAAAGERRVMILGAWGCGAFGNDPCEMAVLFRDALRRAFEERVPIDEVHFAIPVFNQQDLRNPEEFRKVLRAFAAELGQDLEEIV